MPSSGGNTELSGNYPTPMEIPVDAPSADTQSGFEKQAAKTEGKKPALKNSSPERWPRAKELCFLLPWSPPLPSSGRWPLQRLLQQHRGNSQSPQQHLLSLQHPVLELQKVCCFFPIPLINCSVGSEGVGLGWAISVAWTPIWAKNFSNSHHSPTWVTPTFSSGNKKWKSRKTWKKGRNQEAGEVEASWCDC